jgi:glycosyltransferase involved in cell wall biosynthesis
MSERDVKIVPVWAPYRPRLFRFLALPFVLLQALAQRAAIYHLHNPDTLPLAILLRIFGRRVIYDTHEDFSERVKIRKWLPGVIRPLVARWVARIEGMVSRRVHAVIATQEAVADRLGGNVVVIGNPPRADRNFLETIQARAQQQLPNKGARCRLVYVGQLSFDRGLFDMVNAMEDAGPRHDARLWLIGPAETRELTQARHLSGWQYVDYLEPVAQEQALMHVARADVGLAMLHDTADFSRADPNKLYEYMAFGKAFIATDFPAWRARLHGIDAGWFVQPGASEQIMEALDEAQNREVLLRKGNAGREFVQGYSWERAAARLLGVYAKVVNKTGRADVG